MPKQNDVHSKANRRTKKTSNKKTFQKSRGLRIKLDQMMKCEANTKSVQCQKQPKKQKKNKYKNKHK